MDLVIRNPAILSRGRSAQDVGGQEMADQNTILGVLGSGSFAALVAYLLNKGASERRSLEEQAEARVAEANAYREADRKAYEAMTARYDAVMLRMDFLEKSLEDVKSQKQHLETRIHTLLDKIAQDELTIAKFKSNEIMYRTEIDSLTEQLAVSKSELVKTNERLARLVEDQAAGKFRHDTLYQDGPQFS